jgi:hypothetical protein
MKRAMVVLALTLAAATAVAADQKPGRGKPNKAAKHGKVVKQRAPPAVEIRFSTGDAGFIHEYYGPRYKTLPPGLRKKVARGEPLPPGWEKKLRPFPAVLERRLIVLPAGHGRGVIDGHAVIYNLRSHAVIDATVLY